MSKYKSAMIHIDKYEQIKAIGGGKFSKGLDKLLGGIQQDSPQCPPPPPVIDFQCEHDAPVQDPLYVGTPDNTRMSDDPYFADFYETDAGWMLACPTPLREFRDGEWGYREYGKEVIVFKKED